MSPERGAHGSLKMAELIAKGPQGLLEECERIIRVHSKLGQRMPFGESEQEVLNA